MSVLNVASMILRWKLLNSAVVFQFQQSPPFYFNVLQAIKQKTSHISLHCCKSCTTLHLQTNLPFFVTICVLGSCTSTYNDFLPPVCIQRHLHGVTDQLINQDVIQWYILWLQVSVPCETSKLNTEMP